MEEFEATLGEQDEEMPPLPGGNASPIPAFVPCFSAIFPLLFVFFGSSFCFRIVFILTNEDI
jgi:hypothetical protein